VGLHICSVANMEGTTLCVYRHKVKREEKETRDIYMSNASLISPACSQLLQVSVHM